MIVTLLILNDAFSYYSIVTTRTVAPGLPLPKSGPASDRLQRRWLWWWWWRWLTLTSYVCCVVGLPAWNDRLCSSNHRQLVAVAIRTLARPFRHDVPHRVSTTQPRPLPARRARRRLRPSAAVSVEPHLAVSLSASLAGVHAEPPAVLSDGDPKVSYGQRRTTVRQGRPARLPALSQVLSQTSDWLNATLRAWAMFVEFWLRGHSFCEHYTLGAVASLGWAKKTTPPCWRFTLCERSCINLKRPRAYID